MIFAIAVSYVAFTMTQVSELLRHENESVARERLKFLKCLPLIAWLRPYDRTWFPGSVADLLARELHSFHYGSAKSWPQIVDSVRADLWETGAGSEMFVDDDTLWSALRDVSLQQLEDSKYIASLARVRVDGISEMTVEDCEKAGHRPLREWPSYAVTFAKDVKNQLEQRGDKRLQDANIHAGQHVVDTFRRIASFAESGKGFVNALLEHFDIPRAIVSPKTTVEEIGELGVYSARMKVFSGRLRPPCRLTIADVPIRTLPSYVIERGLAEIQQNASRVRGSDLGDAHLASLIPYADGVQVDKRTLHYLNRVARSDPKLGSLFRRPFKEADYSKIPAMFSC